MHKYEYTNQNYKIKISIFKYIILIYNLKSLNTHFLTMNILNSHSDLRTRIQKNTIQIIVNAKSQRSENCEIWHFSRILHHSTKFWKYASFEGVIILVTTLFFRHLGIKKALTKSAYFINSRAENLPYLVQNVKNQFFH